MHADTVTCEHKLIASWSRTRPVSWLRLLFVTWSVIVLINGNLKFRTCRPGLYEKSLIISKIKYIGKIVFSNATQSVALFKLGSDMKFQVALTKKLPNNLLKSIIEIMSLPYSFRYYFQYYTHLHQNINTVNYRTLYPSQYKKFDFLRL